MPRSICVITRDISFKGQDIFPGGQAGEQAGSTFSPFPAPKRPGRRVEPNPRLVLQSYERALHGDELHSPSTTTVDSSPGMNRQPSRTREVSMRRLFVVIACMILVKLYVAVFLDLLPRQGETMPTMPNVVEEVGTAVDRRPAPDLAASQPGLVQQVRFLALSEDGRWLAIGNGNPNNTTTYLWRFDKGNTEPLFPGPFVPRHRRTSFSVDNNGSPRGATTI